MGHSELGKIELNPALQDAVQEGCPGPSPIWKTEALTLLGSTVRKIRAVLKGGTQYHCVLTPRLFAAI